MLKKNLISTYRELLITKKQELIQVLTYGRSELVNRETGGDEVDQSSAILAENQLLSIQNKYRHTLIEVEAALGRIERNCFGLCEETEEYIEEERLMIIPWTRLSIEGAELHESRQKRYNVI